jgi:drug/metabolite transporter (DMT)-like permease
VLASLYPVVTVLLAASLLRERIAPMQRAGIALTLAGVVLISF